MSKKLNVNYKSNKFRKFLKEAQKQINETLGLSKKERDPSLIGQILLNGLAVLSGYIEGALLVTEEECTAKETTEEAKEPK